MKPAVISRTAAVFRDSITLKRLNRCWGIGPEIIKQYVAKCNVNFKAIKTN